MSVLSPPFDSMLANFRLASGDYPSGFKSKHWDVFDESHIQRLLTPICWENFRNNGLTAGMDIGFMFRASPPNVELDNPHEINQHKRRYRSLIEIVGRDFYARATETSIGNPVRVTHDGFHLNTTDMRLVHDAWRIFNALKALGHGVQPMILEIGGGFGGLAAKLKKLIPAARIILLDLPEVNAIQTYYLWRNFHEARIFDYQAWRERGGQGLMNEDWDFALLPGWVADYIPSESVECAINTRSMQEMNLTTVQGYMQVINRVVRPGGAFYCINRYAKSTVGEKIRIKDFPFDCHWYFSISQPAWDQPWVHELLSIRVALPNADITGLLKSLPPVSWRSISAEVGSIIGGIKKLTWGGHHNINPGLLGHIRLLGRSGKLWLRSVAIKMRRLKAASKNIFEKLGS